MSWIEAIPFFISAVLLVLCILFYLHDQKKFKQKMEDDMQQWFEDEYDKGLKNIDRRHDGREGGRRTIDKRRKPKANTEKIEK